jgi:glycosyltransferase involved in cell wall biosynthesis
MNLWFKFVSEVTVVAPLSKSQVVDQIELAYEHPKLTLIQVSAFDLLSWKSRFKTIFRIPAIFFTIIKQMRKSDHIHLRCPGNMGLIGCVAQIFFPSKTKTSKYAGNWDPESLQPFTYRLQKRILSNRTLAQKMKVLVYGNWSPQNSNLKPFFTATYKQDEIRDTPVRNLNFPLKFIFVGSLVEGKNPIVSCEAVQQLNKMGVISELHLFGEGPERLKIEMMIQKGNLQNNIILHGNVNAESLKKAYSDSHFLLFASKSEGWPKAVAEAMFWACLPITTRVSCVPDMIGYGSRGELIEADPTQIVKTVLYLLKNPQEYRAKAKSAMQWSQAFTLEKFRSEIQNLLHH